MSSRIKQCFGHGCKKRASGFLTNNINCLEQELKVNNGTEGERIYSDVRKVWGKFSFQKFT